MPKHGELLQQQQRQPQVIEVNMQQNINDVEHMNVQMQNNPMMQVQNHQMQQDEMQDQIQENIQENLPPVLDEQVKEPEEQIIPVSKINMDGIFSAYGDFAEIKERDSERMKAVKRALITYKSQSREDDQTVLTDIDNLDNLISACRWYNATRWSLRSNARQRQRDVKSILEIAKKERSRLSRLNTEREKQDKNAKKENQNAVKEKTEQEDRRGGALIRREYNGNWTDSMHTNASIYWARFKACTFGFVGRNILNIGMGILGGAAWLATYPLAALVGAVGSASGNKELKKYYKGFNIKIPRPMSPNGWYRYYLHDQKHATSAINRMDDLGKSRSRIVGEFLLRFPQYNIWHPLKHILTLDIKHLSGGGYIEPHKKDKMKKMEALANDELRNNSFDYDDDDASDAEDI